MGMYDYVKYTDNCHVCGEPLTHFQSKDWLCDFLELESIEVQEFRATCEKCRAIHKYTVEREISPDCIKLKNITLAVEKFDHPIKRIPLKTKQEGDYTGWSEQFKGGVLEIKEIVLVAKGQIEAAKKRKLDEAD